ncbi:MAG TPA: prepilin peptidase, partial [Pseudonocardia sp.]
MAHLIVFGGLGMLAGSAARALLARLPRGALVPPPWCELVVGALWATCGCGWSSGLLPTRWLPLMLGLAWLGVAAGTVDLMHRRLPDALTLPAGPLALAAALPLGAPVVLRAAVCGMVLVGAHMAVRALAPAALGAG